jgi:hypothetical protein
LADGFLKGIDDEAKCERLDFWEVPRLSQVFRRCFGASATLFARGYAQRAGAISKDKMDKA